MVEAEKTEDRDMVVKSYPPFTIWFFPNLLFIFDYIFNN